MALNATAELEAILDAAIAAVRVDHQVSLKEAVEAVIERLDKLPKKRRTAIYDALFRDALRAAAEHRLTQ